MEAGKAAGRQTMLAATAAAVSVAVASVLGVGRGWGERNRDSEIDGGCDHGEAGGRASFRQRGSMSGGEGGGCSACDWWRSGRLWGWVGSISSR